jgi:hypothetical protein
MPVCPKCGTAISSPSSDFCTLCGHPLPSSGQQIPSAFFNPAIPWESVETLGIIRALSATLRECLFSPSLFFAKVSHSHNTGMAFVYALILGSAGSIVGFLWAYLFLSWLPDSVPWFAGFSDSASTSGASLILMPLLIAAQIVFAAVYFQILLTLTGSKKQGIKSTFRVVCYAESATILNLIPLVGSFVSVALSLYLLAVGISSVHRMSTIKALVIILLPLLILGIIGILTLAVIIGFGALFNGFL